MQSFKKKYKLKVRHVIRFFSKSLVSNIIIMDPTSFKKMYSNRQRENPTLDTAQREIINN